MGWRSDRVKKQWGKEVMGNRSNGVKKQLGKEAMALRSDGFYLSILDCPVLQVTGGSIDGQCATTVATEVYMKPRFYDT